MLTRVVSGMRLWPKRVDCRIVYTYPGSYERRTDEKFGQKHYTAHQKMESPLIAANIGCVSQFVRLHACSLSGKRKEIAHILDPWTSTMQTCSSFESGLQTLRGAVPSEFAQQPRLLPEGQLDHFMCLTVGMSILLQSDPDQREAYLSYAKDLLKVFVDNAVEFYLFCITPNVFSTAKML